MEYSSWCVPAYHSAYRAMWSYYDDKLERLMGWDSTHAKSDSKSKYKKHIYPLNFTVK